MTAADLLAELDLCINKVRERYEQAASDSNDEAYFAAVYGGLVALRQRYRSQEFADELTRHRGHV